MIKLVGYQRMAIEVVSFHVDEVKRSEHNYWFGKAAWRFFLLTAIICGALFGPILESKAQIVVGDSGTPTYSHGIGVPPGIAGMDPKLGIAFSGSGGINGPLGYGWSLQGVSSITRCAAIPAIDGKRTAVVYGPNDKLCLDGQRLIQTNGNGSPLALASQINDALGTSTTAVREYRTEKDTYARIRAYGFASGDSTGNGGAAYFKVWTKSGQVYEYGASPLAIANSNTLITVQGRPAVAAVWAVSRISDTVGNYMTFKYEQREMPWGSGPVAGLPTLGREWNLLEIEYTGNVSQNQVPVNKVVFNYSDRSGNLDKAEAYHQGTKNVSIRLLNSIVTYVNSGSIPVKTVNLVYSNSPASGRSRVASIKECAGVSTTNCLPPVVFTYYDGAGDGYVQNNNLTALISTTQLLSATNASGVLTGDFNGDGKTDLIFWFDSPASNQLWLSNGDGSFTQKSGFITNQNLGKSDGCFSTIVADFSGDGLPDLLRVSNQRNSAGVSCGAYVAPLLYVSQGDGTFAAPVQISGPVLSKSRSLQLVNCLVPVIASVAIGTSSNCIETGDSVGWTAGSNYYFIDVDGDGILDIVTAILPARTVTAGPVPAYSSLCATIVCTQFWKGNGNGTFVMRPTNVANFSLYAPPILKNEDGFRSSSIVDIDGDGLSDIVGIPSSLIGIGYGWRSRGDGNFDQATAPDPCGFPIDFNGDGKTDCLQPPGDQILLPSYNRLSVSNGTGSMTGVAGFNLTAVGDELYGLSYKQVGPNLVPGPPNVGIVVADFNGDGRQDILRWKDDPAQNVLYLSNGDGSFRQSSSFVFSNATTSGPIALKKSDNTVDFVTGDFRGLGVIDILILSNNATAGNNTLYTKAFPTPLDQLQSVVSSTGIKTDLTWRALSNSSNPLGSTTDLRYVSDNGTANKALPASKTIDLAVPFYVVTSLTMDTGVGTGSNLKRETTNYSYLGFKADLRGRGALGFREVRSQRNGADGTTPVTIATTYLQKHPYIGLAITSSTYLGTLSLAANVSLAALPRSQSEFLYCDQTLTGTPITTSTAPCVVTSLVQRPYLYKSIESGIDLGSVNLPTVTSTNTFNGSGDITLADVTTEIVAVNALPAQSFRKSTQTAYAPNNTSGDNWILGRLLTATVTSQVPDLRASLTTTAGTAPRANDSTGTAQGLTVAIAPAALNVTQANPGVVSGSAIVSVTAPSSLVYPLNYSWSTSACAAISISPVSGTSSSATLSTGFSANVANGASVNGTCLITVTDATGRVGSANFPVSLTVSSAPLNAVSVSPSPLLGSRNNPGVISASTSTAFSGGAPPYNISWSRLTGSRISPPSAISGATSTSFASGFSANLNWAENLSEQFAITVTDSIGQTTSAGLTVTFTSPAALSINASPSTITVNSQTNGGTASGSATVTASGGLPPYSFSWSKTSGGDVVVDNPSAATTTFSSVVSYGSSTTSTFAVAITDAAGNSIGSAANAVTVTATGPAPLPAPSVSPTAVDLGTANYNALITAVVTVTNNGGAGPFSVSLPASIGQFGWTAGSCPANGANFAGGSSCTLNVTYRGDLQCGGASTTFTNVLTVAIGSASASTSLSARNFVYSPTNALCL